MSEWKTVKLKDLLSYKGYIRGPFGSALRRGEMQQSGIPVYEQEHAINEIRHFRYFIDEKKYNELKRFTVVTDDIIISCSGTVGRISVIKKNDPIGIISQALLILRSNPNIVDVNYLKYFLRSKVGQNAILERSNGSVQVNICKREIIEEIPVPLPSLDTQKNIAKILSSLDDKIELNIQINHNLEEQAKAIFKSWFVDFEPFQDGKFVDSELGQIPAGWQVADVYSIASVIYGAPFASKRFSAEKIGRPIVRIRDLATEAPQVYTDEIHPKGYIIKPGDIVVGMDGEFRAYLWGGEEAWLNQRVCVFQPKDNFSSAFVRLSIMPLLAAVEASEVATTVIHLGKNDIDKFKIILPDAETLRKYNAVAVPLYKQIVENKLESRRLAQLRDALLPKLMSGELDISEVQV